MLFFFDVGNPTGHYSLDMSKPVHRVVLKRLLQSSSSDGAWMADCTKQNLRNFVACGRKVSITDPALVAVPRAGTVHFDYLQACLCF